MQIRRSLERFISHWVQYGGGRDDGGQLDARLSFNSRCDLIDGSMWTAINEKKKKKRKQHDRGNW